MLGLLQFALFLGVVMGLAYIKATKIMWTTVVGGVLLLFTVLWREMAWGVLLFLWIGYVAVAALFNYEPWRLRYLSQPILRFFRKALPPISTTEQEALSAGDVWWEGELFKGDPNWSTLLSMPKPTLTGEEQAFLDNQVEVLCSMLNDWEITQYQRDLPKEAWDYIKQERFWGMIIDKRYGGLGFSALAHSLVISKLATANVGAAVTVMVPNSLGPAELIMHYGTEEQKNYYLPRLARGEEIPCFGLTGVESGSDAGAMLDHGVVCKGDYQGKEVIGIRLSWNKRYITLAPVATLLGLAFRLSDPEHLLGDQEEIGITLCLIPTDHPGVEIGMRHWPSNPGFMNGPTRGKDVFIPLDWVIGGRAMLGQGWRMIMECLGIGRSISLPALGTAILKQSARVTSAYAKIRQQFKIPIGYFEGVQEALGRLGAYAYLAEATRLFTTIPVQAKLKPSIASAIAKYHISELSRQGMNDAMDIHAGRGIQQGPHNYLFSAWLGLPISITVEGANILTRNLIIFGQGVLRCHPYLRMEMEAANQSDDTKALLDFDKALNQHIAYWMNNLARSLALALTRSRLAVAPVQGEFAHYYRQLTRMSAALATVTDITIGLLGGAFKRKERISARLGDVLSYLYLASAVLKLHQERQSGSPEEDGFAKWCLDYCLYQIQEAFMDLFANYPNRWVGLGLRLLTFPLGYHYRKPADQLTSQLVNLLLKPSVVREWLTAGGYLGSPAIKSLELAFTKLEKVKPLLKKVQQAVQNQQIAAEIPFIEQVEQAKAQKILSDEEVEALSAYEKLRQEVIRVDEFTQEEMAGN